MNTGKILEARYLNVDFVVEADFDLSPIVAILNKKVLFLWSENSPSSSSFGIESKLTNSETPEEDIVELFQILEKIPDEYRNILFDSKKKVVDIGFECGTMATAIDIEISPNTIRRITDFGCSINIRFYPWVVAPG